MTLVAEALLSSYRPDLEAHCAELLMSRPEKLLELSTQIEVEVVRRPDEGIGVVDGIAKLPTNTPTEEQFRLAVEIARQGGKGFKGVRKRWVVERTFAWLLTFRRLKVDDEESIPISEGFIYAAGSSILLNRLCA